LSTQCLIYDNAVPYKQQALQEAAGAAVLLIAANLKHEASELHLFCIWHIHGHLAEAAQFTKAV
jgi:hypothetical protein